MSIVFLHKIILKHNKYRSVKKLWTSSFTLDLKSTIAKVPCTSVHAVVHGIIAKVPCTSVHAVVHGIIAKRCHACTSVQYTVQCACSCLIEGNVNHMCSLQQYSKDEQLNITALVYTVQKRSSLLLGGQNCFNSLPR